jgi:ABC-2 type transport system permease protein
MRAIDVALKDLVQTSRDWKSFMFLLLMPIAFTFFFGLIFGATSDAEDPRLPVAIVLQEGSGPLAEALRELLETSEAIRPVLLEGDDAENAADLVGDGEYAAALVLPAGFSDQALALALRQDAATGGANPTLIADEATQAGQTAVGAIEAVFYRLLASTQVAQISAGLYDDLAGFEPGQEEDYVDEALGLAGDAWLTPPVSVSVQHSGDSEGAEEEDWNPYGHASAGMLVQFVVMGLSMPATVLVLERQCGALQRMLTTPISRTAVIAGHVLAMFVVVFIQTAILILFGQLALDLEYAAQPVATLLLAVVLALWGASLGLLISVIARAPEHATTLAMIAMFVFSALGGAWFPLDIAGETFAAIGHLMPTAWAIDGLENIVIRGLGLTSVLLPAGIVLLYAAAFFVLAIWRFRYE